MGHLRSLVVATVLAATTTVVLGPLTTAPAGAAVVTNPTVDPTSRASVLAGYRSSLLDARAVPTGWTGDAATCRTGTESAASVAATTAAVNYYRALNRLRPIAMDARRNATALATSLLMQANGTVTHTPPATWRCATPAARATAGTSNLVKGAAGATAVDLYMADSDSSNTAAGHRRWLLDPTASVFGTGSTAGFNVLTVIGGPAVARPAGTAWVAWPNAGFVPKRALRPSPDADDTMLFSLSSNIHPGARYAGASVTVKVGSTALAVDVHPVHDGYGDNTLTWDVALPAGYDTSDADVRFDITVTGMRTASGQAIPTRSYSSTAIVTPTAPPNAPSAPGRVTAAAGNGQATVAWTAPADGGSAITGYRVTPSVAGTARPATTFSGPGTRRAVTGLANGTTYSFRVQALNAAGPGALSPATVAVVPTATPAPYAPYGSWGHLVDQVHRQLVGRLPTSAERSRWEGDLQVGVARPGDLVDALRRSSRHATVVDPVTRLYQAYYRRLPDPAGLDYWIAERLEGRSLRSISAFFARSSEFADLYGGLTHREFVDQIYANILGRRGEASGTTYWTGEIASGRRGRGEVVLGFSESAENRAARASVTTVSVLYAVWLDRSPTAIELADGVAALDGGQSVADYADTLLPEASVLP